MPKDFLTLLSHCITQCRLTWDRRSSILERGLEIFICLFNLIILSHAISTLEFLTFFFRVKEREKALVRRCHRILDLLFYFSMHSWLCYCESLKVQPPPAQNLVFFEHLLGNVFDINLLVYLFSCFLILRISMEEAFFGVTLLRHARWFESETVADTTKAIPHAMPGKNSS